VRRGVLTKKKKKEPNVVTSVYATRTNGHPFLSSRKKYFFEGGGMSDYFSEDENNPNWSRFKAQFTY
jgi:hypothetical protein